MTPCQRLSIEARFLTYVEPMANGCMIWTGARSKGGPGKEGRKKRGGPYGSFHVTKEIGSKRAHIVWAWLSGRIPTLSVPDGHHLDHECKSTLCVCCQKLVTKSENLSLSKTRPKDVEAAKQIKAEADRVRRNRRRKLARAARKSVRS